MGQAFVHEFAGFTLIVDPRELRLATDEERKTARAVAELIEPIVDQKLEDSPRDHFGEEYDDLDFDINASN